MQKKGERFIQSKNFLMMGFDPCYRIWTRSSDERCLIYAQCEIIGHNSAHRFAHKFHPYAAQILLLIVDSLTFQFLHNCLDDALIYAIAKEVPSVLYALFDYRLTFLPLYSVIDRVSRRSVLAASLL